MTDNSEWKLVKEPYFDEPSNTMFQAPAIKRMSDGFTLIPIGLGREKQETFLVRVGGDEFKFVANRWDDQNQQPLDKYTVYTNRITGNDLHLCKVHSEAIEYALMNFPVVIPHFNKIPVKEVIFDIGKWTDHIYVSAKDVNNGRS